MQSPFGVQSSRNPQVGSHRVCASCKAQHDSSLVRLAVQANRADLFSLMHKSLVPDRAWPQVGGLRHITCSFRQTTPYSMIGVSAARQSRRLGEDAIVTSHSVKARKARKFRNRGHDCFHTPQLPSRDRGGDGGVI